MTRVDIAIEVLEEMKRKGIIHAWRHIPRGFEDVRFEIYIHPMGIGVVLDALFGFLLSTDLIKRQVQIMFDAAVAELAAAVHKHLHLCVEQPAAECAIAPPHKVPDLFHMRLPKGYRWPVTTLRGERKRHPVPSQQIGMFGLYSVALDAYRRGGSMRRLKRDLVALNIALAFDQRLNDADLYATREVSADRVRSRIRGLCTYRCGWTNAPDLCGGRRRGPTLWSGDDALCLPLSAREVDEIGSVPTVYWPHARPYRPSYIGAQLGGYAWAKLTVS